jgi:putative membrane protein
MMGDGFGMGIPGLGMVLVWVAIIVLVVWLVGALVGNRRLREKGAREILDERLARGEINQDEYEQLKKRLHG